MSKIDFACTLFFRLLLTASTICFVATSVYSATDLQNVQLSQPGSAIETIASFSDIVPRSIAVSLDGRIFLCCPRGHNAETSTLVEVKNGNAVPYPDAVTNKIDLRNCNQSLFSAMSAVVDNNNNLWVLDNGHENRMLVYGGAKLIGINLNTNKVFKTILLKNYVLSSDIVLYDLEIDLLHGKSGTALISASGSVAPGTMIVSDLETGRTMRRLNQHSSLCPGENLSALVEGELVRVRRNNFSKEEWLPGAFSLRINGSYDRLYYSAVASQEIFSVDLSKLCDPNVSDAEVEDSIRHIAYKIALGTGIECDRQNRIYLSDVQHSAICRYGAEGTIDLMVHSEKLSYADHLLIANDGYLYVTTSKFKRGPNSLFGEDERFAPFEVLRIPINTTSATLCSHAID